MSQYPVISLEMSPLAKNITFVNFIKLQSPLVRGARRKHC